MSSLATTIDHLPAEMISELFKHLHPMDLASCSLVNKLWYSIYSGFKVNSVVAVGRSAYYTPVKWSHPDRKIEEKELCDLKLFNSLVDRPLFSNLKNLILGGEPSGFDLTKLNKFVHLRHLVINRFLGTIQLNISFPKLKVLAFAAVNEQCSLFVDCPELEVLAYRGEPAEKSLLVVKHPETIQQLGTDMFGPKLAPFKNVERFKTQRFEAICKATLLWLPKLKELHYNVDIFSYLGQYAEIGKLERMKQELREFLSYVRELRGPDFRFRFAGFQLDDTTLEKIDFGKKVYRGRELVFNEYIYMKNYQLIDPDSTLDFVYRLDYTRLMSCAAGKIPAGFCKKFDGVHWTKAKGARGTVPDNGHLLCFLKSLDSLRRLDLEKLRLSQEFYDQLPSFCGSLAELHLWEDDEELQLNFDFIGELKHLSGLLIQAELSLQSVESLARWSGNLEKCLFSFRAKRNRFLVQKTKDSKVWKVTDSGFQNVVETENPEDIVNFLQNFRDQRHVFGLKMTCLGGD